MKVECMRAWDYLQKTSCLLPNADIIKKAHKNHDEWKMYWLWNIESHPYF